MWELCRRRASRIGAAAIVRVIGPRSFPKLAERTLDVLSICYSFQSSYLSRNERLQANSQRWVGV